MRAYSKAIFGLKNMSYFIGPDAGVKNIQKKNCASEKTFWKALFNYRTLPEGFPEGML